MLLDRRSFTTGGLALLACAPTTPLPTPDGRPWMGGTYLGIAPWLEPLTRPLESKYRSGLDARLITDLSVLRPETLHLDEPAFYIRTEQPDQLDVPDEDWRIAITGRATGEPFTLEDLRALEEPMGAVLLECSGNGPAGRFGLMSSTTWSGVRLADLVDLLELEADAWGVEVVGFDAHSEPSENNHSTPGASWVLPLEQLASTGAFLATSMAGAPLRADHGRPVRLVVPNWYGCCCIKWVDGLHFVDRDAPSTGQMVEFASRTEQPNGIASPLARDYLLPEIDHAATVVRVERWRVDGSVRHRVVGIAWGGQEPPGTLSLRIDDQEHPVDVQPERDLRTWALWEHVLPEGLTGDVRLGCSVDGVRTRRLDRGFYDQAFTLG